VYILSPNQPGKSVQLCYPRSQSCTLWPYSFNPDAIDQPNGSAINNKLGSVTTPQTWNEVIPLRRPNLLLLTPAIFGSAAAFIVGFGRFGHSLSCGYDKYIFFITVYVIIASLGTGAYIYEVMSVETGRARLSQIILPLLTVVIMFALLYNLTYTLYPCTYSGTIGDTPITQFLSFLSLSVGLISVGESFNINREKTGSQILGAIESFWNLFVLSLVIALIAGG